MRNVQPSFTGGELSEAVQARIDIAKYQSGLKRCENFFVRAEGGVSNRQGLQFTHPAKFRDKAWRPIPFQFNTEQTYILEFGEYYMRVVKDGGLVLNASKVISAVAATAGRQITSNAHGYSDGDWVFITGTGTDIDDRYWRVDNATTNTFTIESVFDDAAAAAGDAAVVGSVAQVYEIATPYPAAALPIVRYAQDADVMNLTHGDYIEQKLSRTDHNAWTMEDVDRTIPVDPPANLAATFSVSDDRDELQRYLVTVVHSGGESGGFGNASGEPARTRYDIGETGDARDPDAEARITWNASVDAISYNIYRRKNVSGGVGTVGQYYLIGNTTDTEFTDSFIGLDETTPIPTPGVGGIAVPTPVTASTYTPPADDDLIKYVVTATDADTLEESVASTEVSILATLTKTGARVTLTWDAVPNNEVYKVYKEISVGAGLFGYIGESTEEKFTDSFITPDYDTPPVETNLFNGVGNYPRSVGYHKQRRVYGGTANRPQTFYGSKTAAYDNMNVSTPARETDSYQYTIAAQKVNAIRHVVSKRNLMIFTTGGEFIANGGDADKTITPSNINVDLESTYGCSDLAPLVIGDNVLFAESTDAKNSPDYGTAVREFGYEFATDGYRGNERTVLASHLFEKWKLKAWDYAARPYHIIWGVREDGEAVCMTYLIEHDVWGWHRHITDGEFEGVAVIRENGEDVPYFAVKREVNGQTVRYCERLSSREWRNVEDAFFVDSGLTFNSLNEGGTTLTLSGGTNWTPDEDLTLTASAGVFTADMVGKTIKMYSRYRKTQKLYDNTRLEITAYTSATEVEVEAKQVVPVGMRNKAVDIWGVGTETVSGLHHLEDKEVSILADGNVSDSKTVSNGMITLDEPTVKAHIGLPYDAIFQTLAIAVTPYRDDNSVSREVNVVNAKLKVEKSRGFEVGRSLDKMRPIKTRDRENWGEPTQLYDGVLDANISGDWKDGSFFVRMRDPLPVSVNMVMPDVQISDR